MSTPDRIEELTAELRQAQAEYLRATGWVLPNEERKTLWEKHVDNGVISLGTNEAVGWQRAHDTFPVLGQYLLDSGWVQRDRGGRPCWFKSIPEGGDFLLSLSDALTLQRAIDLKAGNEADKNDEIQETEP